MKKNNKLLLCALISGLLVTSNNLHAVGVEQSDGTLSFTSLQGSNYQLTLIAPNGQRHSFEIGPSNATISPDMLNLKGFSDGFYRYELSPVFKTGNLGNEVRELNDAKLSEEFSNEFANNDLISGNFSMFNNQLVERDALEETAVKDFLINDDLIVDGSACIGFDCVNGENFGFDTIRLKENNLRIKFDDTSNGASFPSTDWQLTANDSANGGANKFSIDDITSGRTPFTVEGNAPSNALYVDDGGRLGLGTSIPVTDIHIVDGDSPTIRLEQNGSSGFGPQTWDIAGNETNFFIRDTSNGSTLPFRIRPRAPTSSIYIDTDGDVGLGVSAPAASLNVVRNDGTAQVLVQENSGTTADRIMFKMTNNGGTRMDFENTSGGAQANTWRMASENNTGSFIITEVGSGAKEFEITTTGDILAKGVVVHSSDVNLKKNIVEVDAQAVLEKVSNLPISTWQYKDQSSDIIHMGPMAQDFRKAFGLGHNDTTISDTDIAGVALASIQALKSELQEEKRKNTLLEKRLFNIETQLLENNRNKAVASQ